jgi:hypothetical protein
MDSAAKLDRRRHRHGRHGEKTSKADEKRRKEQAAQDQGKTDGETVVRCGRHCAAANSRHSTVHHSSESSTHRVCAVVRA